MTTPVPPADPQVEAPPVEPQQPEPQTPPEQDAPPEPRKEWSPDDAQREIEKLRKENASWRTKYRDAEPIVKAHQEAEERNKTELQRATERATTLEQQLAAAQQQTQLLGFAAKYGIPEDDYDLLGSGTPEEMESRAVRLAHYRTSALGTPEQQSATPPTQRPVESLRPGASPQPPARVDNSYPDAWRPVSRGQS